MISNGRPNKPRRPKTEKATKTLGINPMRTILNDLKISKSINAISQHTKGQAADLEIYSVPNIKVAYWLSNNVDFDQLILEYYDKNDPAGGWIHISYNEKGNNRKQVLTFDGDKYENGLPDMEWKDGKVVGS